MPHLKDETISGVPVSISVSESGYFAVATKGGEVLGSADTIEKAIQRARPKLAQQKVKVSIEFVTKTGQRGLAYGLHARNNTVLARVAGEAKQLDDYRERSVFKADIPSDQLDRFLELGQEIKARETERRAIAKEYEFDIADATRKAIEAKAAAAIAEEDNA